MSLQREIIKILIAYFWLIITFFIGVDLDTTGTVLLFIALYLCTQIISIVFFTKNNAPK